MNEVTAQFIHDAKVRTVEDMHWLISPAIMRPTRKSFMPTIKDTIAPLTDIIPEPIKPLLDVNKMVEDVFYNVIDGVIYQVWS